MFDLFPHLSQTKIGFPRTLAERSKNCPTSIKTRLWPRCIPFNPSSFAFNLLSHRVQNCTSKTPWSTPTADDIPMPASIYSQFKTRLVNHSIEERPETLSNLNPPNLEIVAPPNQVSRNPWSSHFSRKMLIQFDVKTTCLPSSSNVAINLNRLDRLFETWALSVILENLMKLIQSDSDDIELFTHNGSKWRENYTRWRFEINLIFKENVSPKKLGEPIFRWVDYSFDCRNNHEALFSIRLRDPRRTSKTENLTLLGLLIEPI